MNKNRDFYESKMLPEDNNYPDIKKDHYDLKGVILDEVN